MKIKKVWLSIVMGIGYGYLSFWWLLLAIVFAFPDTSQGMRDWEEDVTFIPLGYIMLIAYVILGVILIVKNRKNKKQLILFIITTLLTIGLTVLLKTSF